MPCLPLSYVNLKFLVILSEILGSHAFPKGLNAKQWTWARLGTHAKMKKYFWYA
jgi:hypothetical protein